VENVDAGLTQAVNQGALRHPGLPGEACSIVGKFERLLAKGAVAWLTGVNIVMICHESARPQDQQRQKTAAQTPAPNPDRHFGRPAGEQAARPFAEVAGQDSPCDQREPGPVLERLPAEIGESDSQHDAKEIASRAQHERERDQSADSQEGRQQVGHVPCGRFP
jgi:hypothetical protein